ncbi:MAG: hypothetical protein VB858_21405 [Planctomycetaceae bacterium]
MDRSAAQPRGGRGRVIRQSDLSNPLEPDSVSIPTGVEHQQTQVNLIREGDVIREIEVTCSCGEVLRLNCQYD